jgi:enoyl-CoA hydratase
MRTGFPVNLSREGAVGVVEIARPEKFNSLSLDVHRGIDAALTEFEAVGSGVRAVLICSQGKHFSTGADLDEVKAWRGEPAKLEHYTRYGHAVLKRLEASPLPVAAS